MYDFSELKIISELSQDYTPIQQIMPVKDSDAREGTFV